MQIKITVRYDHTLLEWLFSKGQKITSVDKDVEKWEPLCTVDENVNWFRLWITVWSFLKKIKNRATI